MLVMIDDVIAGRERTKEGSSENKVQNSEPRVEKSDFRFRVFLESKFAR